MSDETNEPAEFELCGGEACEITGECQARSQCEHREPEAWPFAPGDVVHDSGEDGDDAAWLDAAPVGTVVQDRDGVLWTRRTETEHLPYHWAAPGDKNLVTSKLLVHRGPMTVHDGPLSAVEYDDERQAVAHWLDRNYGPALHAAGHRGHDWLAAADDLLEVAHAAHPAAQDAPAASPAGVGTSEVATGAPGGAGETGLGDAIRAIIPATYTDDGYFGVTALEIGEFADRADALERGGRELGRQIQRYLTWVLDATGMHHLIDEDGDGDWELVWERLAEMGRAYATSPSEIEQVAEQCDQMISIQGYDAVRCERDTGHSGMHWSNGELSVTTPKAIQ